MVTQWSSAALTKSRDSGLVALRQLWLPYGNCAILGATEGVLMILQTRAEVKENLPLSGLGGLARRSDYSLP